MTTSADDTPSKSKAKSPMTGASAPGSVPNADAAPVSSLTKNEESGPGLSSEKSKPKKEKKPKDKKSTSKSKSKSKESGGEVKVNRVHICEIVVY